MHPPSSQESPRPTVTDHITLCTAMNAGVTPSHLYRTPVQPHLYCHECGRDPQPDVLDNARTRRVQDQHSPALRTQHDTAHGVRLRRG